MKIFKRMISMLLAISLMSTLLFTDRFYVDAATLPSVFDELTTISCGNLTFGLNSTTGLGSIYDSETGKLWNQYYAMPSVGENILVNDFSEPNSWSLISGALNQEVLYGKKSALVKSSNSYCDAFLSNTDRFLFEAGTEYTLSFDLKLLSGDGKWGIRLDTLSGVQSAYYEFAAQNGAYIWHSSDTPTQFEYTYTNNGDVTRLNFKFIPIDNSFFRIWCCNGPASALIDNLLITENGKDVIYEDFETAESALDTVLCGNITLTGDAVFDLADLAESAQIFMVFPGEKFYRGNYKLRIRYVTSGAKNFRVRSEFIAWKNTFNEADPTSAWLKTLFANTGNISSMSDGIHELEIQVPYDQIPENTGGYSIYTYVDANAGAEGTVTISSIEVIGQEGTPAPVKISGVGKSNNKITFNLNSLIRYNSNLEAASCSIYFDNEGMLKYDILMSNANTSFTQVDYPPVFYDESDNTKWLIPKDSGLLLSSTDTESYLNRKLDVREFYSANGLSMAFFAGINAQDNSSYLAIIDTPINATIGYYRSKLGSKDGYIPMLSFAGQKGVWSENRSVRFKFLQSGSYVTAAKEYRNIADQKGFYVTYNEKAANNPQVLKTASAHRIDLGIDIKELLPAFDKIYDAGVSNFMVKTVSVREVTQGGRYCSEDEIIATDFYNKLKAKYPDAMLYEYMNTRDFYLQDGETKADLILADLVKDNLSISSNGNPYPGWTDMYGVTAFIACPTFSRTYLDYRMNKYPLSIYPTSIKLFDILGTCTLSEGLCFDSNHLSDRTSTYQSRIDILRYANEMGLDTHTEGVAEYLVPYASSFEGSLGFMQVSGVHSPNTMMTDNNGIANEAERVPLWQLVYHECAGTYWHWEFGDLTNLKSGEYCDLYSLLYGEKGMFLPFYSNSGVTTEYFDIMIERMKKLNQVFLDVATEEMTNHEFLTADGMLQRTTFASGVTVTVNFSKETTHSYDGYTYAPYAWKATGTTFSEEGKEIGTAIKNTHEKRIASIDFEDADNLYWDSPFWTYSDSASVTTVNPISGKKSLLINNEDIEFKSLITLNTSKFPLKNKYQYRFSFNYRIDSAIDINSMQLVLGSGKYVRFNLSTLGVYEGTADLLNSTKLVKQADGSVKVTIIFNAGECDSMRLEGGIYKTGNPLKVMLDDISIEEIYEFNLNEDFKGISSISDTVFFTEMSTNTANEDSMTLSNPKAGNITVLCNDIDKFTLAADTYYELEFTYKLPSPTSMTVMQLRLSGGRYVQFYCYSAYSYGENTLPNTTFTKNSNGTVTVKTNFKTDAAGADASVKLIGGINQYYAMNIEVLEFNIKAPSANVDFEELTDLGNTFYKSDAETVTIDSDFLISGEKSLLVRNSKADFVNLFYTSELFPYLSEGNTYQVSFTYKIDSATDLGLLQFVLGSGRYIRFDCSTQKVTEGNQDIIDNTYFTRNSDGSVTVKIVFTCDGRDSQYGFKLQGGVNQESDIRLVLDDIRLYETVNFLDFDTKNGVAMLSFDELQGITEVGAGIVAKAGSSTAVGTKKVTYVNPEANGNKYFAIKDKTVYYGDLNADGEMNSLDIVSIRKLLLNTTSYKENCDANSDKNFDIRDLIRYKKLLAEECIGSENYSDKYLYPIAVDSVIWMNGDVDIIFTPYYFIDDIKVYCKKINLEYSK